MSKAFRQISILTILLVLLDQISKFFIVKYLEAPYQIIGNFFRMEYSQNSGIAFGIPVNGLILIPLTIILIIFIIHFARKDLDLKKDLAKTSIALIIAGAFGNLIDRFVYDYVIDFIAIWEWPNFNFADSYIAIGVLLVLIFYGRMKRVNNLPGKLKTYGRKPSNH